ncbi:MAG: RNA-binding domain-containing protein, partial [Anaerolineae bacterium]
MHLHTPASADWQEPGVTYLQWLQKAESRGLDIVAITDHNTVEGIARLRAEIERLTWLEANDRLRPQERRDLDEYRRLGNKILVLPGFEFTATFGFHVLAIFPPDTPLRLLELLLLRLNVPVDRLAEGSTEVGATSDVLTAYRLIDEAGGLVIAAHVNSTHGVAMRGFNFGGQTKIAYTQDPHLHALEVTDLDAPARRSTAKFFDGTKPEYPRRMHCIQGSDAHRLVRDPKDKNRLGIGDRVTEILLPEVSFEALAAALKGDDFSVTRPYRPLAEEPFDFVLAAREAGNTIVQSFHESMVVEGGRTNRVLADVVAFANTQGGTIYLGVSAVKKGPPRGVENPQETVARLTREIEQDITPP